MPRRSQQSFGRRLRELRTRRGLSLKDVEALSRRLSPDLAATISQPYASQLELGHSVRISTSKLLALAAIYAVPIEELLGTLPKRRRQAAEEAVRQWRAEGRPEPPPLRYVPSLVADVDGELDDLLSQSGRGTLIAIGDEAAVRATLRKLMLMCLTPPFLALSPDGRLTKDFWRTATAWRLTPEKSDSLPPARRGWHRLVSAFVEWLIYAKRVGPAIAHLAKDWSSVFANDAVEIASQPVSCKLKDADLERRYGFKGMPAAVVYGARWRELAYRFSIENYRSDGDVPFAPKPSAAAVDYVVFCLFGCSHNPDWTEDADPHRLSGAAAVLAKHAPSMGKEDSSFDDTHEAVARFLAGADQNASALLRDK